MPTDLLPDAEMEVLACLRNRGPATAKEAREAMRPYRPMTHGAMVTLLRRLEDKGLVRRKKGPVGKAFIFDAVEGAGETVKKSLRQMVQRIFAGDGVAMVASLFETKPPTLKEVEQLQQLLNNLRGQKQKGSRNEPGE